MKKIIILLFLIGNIVTGSSQNLTTNKVETIDLLSKEFNKTNGLIVKFVEGEYTIKDCKISFEKGFITFTQTFYNEKNDYWSDTYQFSPLYIKFTGDAYNEFKTEKPNVAERIDISFSNHLLVRKRKSDLIDKEEIYLYEKDIRLRTYHYGEEGANIIMKGLLRLQQLLKEENNPLELTTDEQRLSILFAKYKTCETRFRRRNDNNYSNGKKVKIEDIQFSNYGTSCTYNSKRTVTDNAIDYNGQLTEKIEIMISNTDFYWQNVSFLKYGVVSGLLSLISENDDFRYQSTYNGEKFKGKGKDLLTYFKPSVTDTDGQAKKDVLEIISLIKKIVKLYGGGDVKVEIKED